jgi:hypothetical protein
MKIFRTDQVSILNRIKYLSIAICILFTTNLLAQDTTPPSAPKNLISTNITEISFTLSWDASTDNVGIDHYEVYKDGAKIGDVSSTTIEVIGLLILRMPCLFWQKMPLKIILGTLQA